MMDKVLDYHREELATALKRFKADRADAGDVVSAIDTLIHLSLEAAKKTWLRAAGVVESTDP